MDAAEELNEEVQGFRLASLHYFDEMVDVCVFLASKFSTLSDASCSAPRAFARLHGLGTLCSLLPFIASNLAISPRAMYVRSLLA